MQVAPSCVQHQSGEGLNEEQRQNSEVASTCAHSEPLRKWHAAATPPGLGGGGKERTRQNYLVLVNTAG
jgi:hypothetical protein